MKKALHALYAALSSREFVLWMAGFWVLFYVSLAVWTKEAFARFAVGLGENPAEQAAYVLFLVAFALNILRAARGWAKKSVLIAVFKAVFPIGVLLFLFGFFISAAFRHMELRLIGQGDTFGPRWEAEAALTVDSIASPLKEETLESAAERTIFKYEPSIVVAGKDGRRHEVGAFPPVKIGATHYHVLNFGIAPGVRLFKGGTVLDEGYMPLRIIPPGAVDFFVIKPFPYRFTLKIAPRRIVERGGERVRLYDLKDLSYEVQVRKGDELLYEGISKDGGIEFEGHTLAFFEPANWVLVEMVKDRGRIIIIAGICLMLAGLPLGAAALVIRARG